MRMLILLVLTGSMAFAQETRRTVITLHLILRTTPTRTVTTFRMSIPSRVTSIALLFCASNTRPTCWPACKEW